MIKCPVQDRSQVLAAVTQKLRKSAVHQALNDCTIDLLRRSTLAVSLFGAPPVKQHLDVFHGGAQSAVIIGNTIASVQVGSSGYALLVLRRVSGMTQWMIHLQNPVQKPTAQPPRELEEIRQPAAAHPAHTQPQRIPEAADDSDGGNNSLPQQLKVMAHSVSDGALPLSASRAEMLTPQPLLHARTGAHTEPKPETDQSRLYNFSVDRSTSPELTETESERSSMADNSTRTSLQTHSDGSWAKDTFDDLSAGLKDSPVVSSPGVLMPNLTSSHQANEWAARWMHLL